MSLPAELTTHQGLMSWSSSFEEELLAPWCVIRKTLTRRGVASARPQSSSRADHCACRANHRALARLRAKTVAVLAIGAGGTRDPAVPAVLRIVSDVCAALDFSAARFRARCAAIAIAECPVRRTRGTAALFTKARGAFPSAGATIRGVVLDVYALTGATRFTWFASYVAAAAVISIISDDCRADTMTTPLRRGARKTALTTVIRVAH